MTTHPKTILAGYGLEPKKSLGQNFLFDDNVLGRIVEAADLKPGDQVLEIGPGLGSLTRRLAETAGRVVAVELDGRFLPALQNELSGLDNVQIIQGDILDQEPADLFSGPYKVVANVPYYITGAILRHLLGSSHKPSTMVLTIQKEVAERLTAEPPNMSLLAMSVLYYGSVEQVTTIKAGAFWPRPDVDSAVIKIEVRSDAGRSEDEEQTFFRIVRAGFSQKRKQLQKNLRQLGIDRTAVATALEKAGIDGSRRAETLSLDEWLLLVKTIEPNI
ncbi:MAG: 16S rRNA (adenine(1518)-N(6)/adenine(1519)-N(6))-dimethyltransferase RsmA [Candidatus Promineifilaceae bacterium]